MSRHAAFGEAALAQLKAAHRHRPAPRPLSADRLDFVSNDTLGLAVDPEVIAAAREALEAEGLGGRAARHLGGGGHAVDALEQRAAEWLGERSALFFGSGSHANIGVLPVLAGRGTVLHSDARNHASLIDGARLASGLTTIFPHGDLLALQAALGERADLGRPVIVTESVFSMDGDAVDAAALLAIAEQHDALLIVDEAHAVGLLGPRGTGLFGAHAGHPLLVRVVPCGKALGAAGALVTGPEWAVDLVRNQARSFLFSTALPPAVPAGVCAAIDAIASGRRSGALILERTRGLAEMLGLPRPAAAILPVPVGDEARVVALRERLRDQGLEVGAVRPPTVPEGGARLRLTIGHRHTAADVARLASALQAAGYPFHERSEAARVAPLAPACIIAGTDTGVGKTVVSALLVRAARNAGPVRYWKPVQTGDDCDTTTVEALAEGVVTHPPTYRFPLPASPDQAALEAGATLDPEQLSHDLLRLRRVSPDPLFIELAGGVQVPLDGTTRSIDWLARHRLPVMLAARSGLGTLNHTLLTAESLSRHRVPIAALLLVGPPHPENEASLRAHWPRVVGTPLPPLHRVPPLERLDAAALSELASAHPWPGCPS